MWPPPRRPRCRRACRPTSRWCGRSRSPAPRPRPAPAGRPQAPDPRAVEALAYTPDGRRLVSGSQTGEARLWDAETGALLKTFAGHTGGVRRVALLPDGRRFLTASPDKTVKLWDPAAEPPLVRTFDGHPQGVTALAVLPDGGRFLAAMSDGNIWLWGLDAAQPLSKLPKQAAAVQALAVTPDGRRAVFGLYDARRAARPKPPADGAKPPADGAKPPAPLCLVEYDLDANRELRRVPVELAVSYLVLTRDGMRRPSAWARASASGSWAPTSCRRPRGRAAGSTAWR